MQANIEREQKQPSNLPCVMALDRNNSLFATPLVPNAEKLAELVFAHNSMKNSFHNDQFPGKPDHCSLVIYSL